MCVCVCECDSKPLVQRVVRVKKMDEGEDEGDELTQDEVEKLSQGTDTLTHNCCHNYNLNSVDPKLWLLKDVQLHPLPPPFNK